MNLVVLSRSEAGSRRKLDNAVRGALRNKKGTINITTRNGSRETISKKEIGVLSTEVTHEL